MTERRGFKSLPTPVAMLHDVSLACSPGVALLPSWIGPQRQLNRKQARESMCRLAAGPARFRTPPPTKSMWRNRTSRSILRMEATSQLLISDETGGHLANLHRTMRYVVLCADLGKQ